MLLLLLNVLFNVDVGVDANLNLAKGSGSSDF